MDVSVALNRVPVRARLALAGAGALALVLVAGGLIVYHSSTVSHIDTAAYWAFTGLADTHQGLARIAVRIASFCNVGSYVFLVAIPFAIALLRGRLAVAVAVVVVCVCATQTTELLKPLLAAPRPPSGLPAPTLTGGSWPSGHSTAAMAFALSMVLAVPRGLRPLTAALGGIFALLVAYSVLLLGWHYPSDALAGMTMAALWTLLAVAGVAVADARWGRQVGLGRPLRRLPLRPLVDTSHLPSTPVVLAAAALPAAAILIFRAGDAVTYAAGHTSFVAMAVALAGVALASILAVVAAVGVSRSGELARQAS